MKWVVDIGNSAIHWAVAEQGKLQPGQSIYWRQKDLTVLLNQAWSSLAPPDSLLCACVADESFRHAFDQWCQKQWGLQPQYIEAQPVAHGVSNAYRQANRLGDDRWAALIAAYSIYGKACCIIDCGSALTVDVLDDDGQHRGGMILPGLGMMLQSLVSRTAIEASLSEMDAIHLLADNTEDAMQSGCQYALAATIDSYLQDIGAELKLETQNIITGGDAARLLPVLKSKPQHIPDLVLQGLAFMQEQAET